MSRKGPFSFLRWTPLFVLLPLVELYLLIKIGGLIGPLATIGVVAVTGTVGAYLARRQGTQVLGSINQALMRGQLPANELVAGVCVLIAGALLITPGVVTDLVGFTLLVPAARQRIVGYLRFRFEKWISRQRLEGTLHETWQGDGTPPPDSGPGAPPFDT